MARSKRKRKKNLRVKRGQAHIRSTFNNTIVTLTDRRGNAISWSSAGNLGFEGSRKGTPYAAQMAADEAAQEAMEFGLEEVQVFVKGQIGRAHV